MNKSGRLNFNIIQIKLFVLITLLLVLGLFPWQTYAPWAGEDGLIENTQFLLLILSAYISFNVFLLRRKAFKGFDLIPILLAILFLLVAGDEISWGQRLLGLKPLYFNHELNNQREITLHNLNFIEPWIYLIIYGGIFLFNCVLPLTTWLFPRVRNLCLRLGIPLMEPLTCVGFFASILVMVILPRLQYGPVGLTGTMNQLKQLRELVFDLNLFAYLFLDYYRIFLAAQPEATDSEPVNLIKTIWKENGLLLKANRVVIGLLFVFVLLTPLASVWRDYQLTHDQKAYTRDPALTVIEGENISHSNADYWINEKKDCFNKKFLALYTQTLAPEGYLVFTYHFYIKNKGTYRIYLAGMPPGTKTEGNDSYFCQFQVKLDNHKPYELNEENNLAKLLAESNSWFYNNYEYTQDMRITKLGQYSITPGKHQLEFKIDKKPLSDNEYKFYADAIFVVPSGWKPSRKSFSLPDDLLTH